MAREPSTRDFNRMLAGIVAPVMDAPRDTLLPDIAVHVDSALPAMIDLDPEALGAFVSAAIGWIGATGPEGAGSLGFWRGGSELDPGTGVDALIVEMMRRGDVSADTALRAGVAEAARRLGASAPNGARSSTGELLRTVLPGAFSPEAAPGRSWGAAFERRRILVVRDPRFDDRRLARSLAGVGLDATYAQDPEAGVAAAVEADAAGHPFDLVVLCRRLCGDRLGTAVGRLRSLCSGPGMRIVVTAALPEDAANPEIDGTIPRSGPWTRLLPLLFDLLRRPRGEGAKAAAPEVPSFAGHHIIIAEDVSMNRALLQAMLAPTGVTYEVAADGAEAVEAMRRRPADLVLMDIQMPVMDGLEATRRIRAISAGVKVIALTANAREADRETYLAAGMNGYLAKPIRVDDLYAVLRRELG